MNDADVAPHAASLPRPALSIGLDAKPFWDAAAEGRLLLQRCAACSVVIWYPRAICPVCGSLESTWFEASGEGSIYSFTIARRGEGPWREVSPYVVAYVELDEGPRVLTNIIGGPVEGVAIGQRVRAVFEPNDDGVGLMRFVPVR